MAQIKPLTQIAQITQIKALTQIAQITQIRTTHADFADVADTHGYKHAQGFEGVPNSAG
jgi:hypothetical protein